MKILIELLSGPKGSRPVTQQEIQANIDVLTTIADSALPQHVSQSLKDTRSILEGIQKKLPRGY